ncbi:MAG: hypothetical protein ACK47R_00690, partial [Planctomycetia bacterium]
MPELAEVAFVQALLGECEIHLLAEEHRPRKKNPAVENQRNETTLNSKFHSSAQSGQPFGWKDRWHC